MALSRDFPATLREAIQVARRVLESNRDLQRKQVIETEAEQIVMAVMTKFSGRNWTRLDVFSHLSDPMPAEAAQKVLLWAGQRAQIGRASCRERV